ncbi:YdcP family protein [Faecalicatena acetigenes]|uniref:YdcP family protein n=1 Tax=Faecalicatena acetigenes TaxID=2981790 RepID=A0ABT2TCD3_9FIRM|nr:MULTISPECIES: DUF961 family protein [Lachnospiraceae]MCU6747522.1 YdcP family protein [Faecalicatena acetigenes]SCH93678.1 Bacterial protein of uncharacterised function (DUF961) [uncultured Clostridium sp.]
MIRPTFFDYRKVIVDIENSFGVCTFRGMKERTEVDAEGEDTGEVNVRKYVIKSSKQREFEIVNVPIELPVKDFPIGAKVRFVNPKVIPWAPFGGEPQVRINAEDIVLVEGDAKTLEQPKPQQGNNNQPKQQENKRV